MAVILLMFCIVGITVLRLKLDPAANVVSLKSMFLNGYDLASVLKMLYNWNQNAQMEYDLASLQMWRKWSQWIQNHAVSERYSTSGQEPHEF